MKTSDALDKISPALVAALSAMEGAAKSSNNPHFRSKYANLEAVVDASRDVLASNGLAVMQGAGHVLDGKLHLTTRILHQSGQWVESEFAMPLAKQDPQATLAALTYARRGSLMAILGMPAVDDDGETAMGRGQAPANEPAPRKDTGPSLPDAPDWWKAEGPGMSASQAKKEGWGDRHEAMREEIAALTSATGWREWCAENSADIFKLPKAWRQILRAEAEEKAHELGVDFNQRRAA